MIHIQRFVERLQGFEARGTKDFMMPIRDAKDLHADITKLLLALELARESAEKNTQDQVITVEVGGGTF
jgi:1-aminocyclopropane-1-carboxylate deaminase/D-cysteine desulfhydrase-like pyridoxal-dependent ACC family enzyme